MLRGPEAKTQQDVVELVKIAVENGLKIEFIEGSRGGSLAYSSAAEVYSSMSPSEVWNEISRKLKDKGVNVYQDNFNELKSLVNSLESLK